MAQPKNMEWLREYIQFPKNMGWLELEMQNTARIMVNACLHYTVLYVHMYVCLGYFCTLWHGSAASLCRDGL